MALAAGARLGPYEVLSPLGAGGMGEVYRAKDTRLGRTVALKVVPAAVASDPERLRRFEREARAASALNHPNIVTVHDVGAENGVSFIAMEFVDGETVREILADGALSARRLLAIGAQVADGLAKAHAAGIVHRDLKPENVMVSRDGFVKILDFGLAKVTEPWETSGATAAPTVSGATEPGIVMGTVAYMSPEQALGKPLDFRSDQFSLGSILYEMATGRRAFLRPSTFETLSAIIREEPDPIVRVAPACPAPVGWVVERCLAKKPDDRYAATRDLARDLASLRDHLSEISTPAAAVAAPRRRARPGFWLVAAALLVLVAVAGILAGRRMTRVPPPSYSLLTHHRGNIASARFAPDGETVVYSAAWDGKPARLFVKRPDSPEELPISLPSSDILSISRSGELAIAINCRWTGNGICSGALARAPLTAGAARPVLDNVQQADWAPDGDNLVIARDVGSRARIEYPIGKLLYETGGHTSFPRLSPKADLVAFFDHPYKVDNRGSVAVLDLSGHKHTLTKEWEAVVGLAWAPGGDEIWFTASDAGNIFDLHAVSLSGQDRLVARYPITVRLQDVSRGGRVLFTQDQMRVAVTGRAAGEERERDLSWLDWSIPRDISRDGRTVLFEESSSSLGGGYAVCLRGMDGSPVVRLGTGSALAISPDGRWVLIQIIGGKSPALAVLGTGVGGSRDLPSGGIDAEEAEWLDEKRIVLAGAAPARPMRLFVQDVEKGDPRPISPEGIEANFVDRIAPSPDGRFVAAIGPDHKIAIFPVDGGVPRPLAGAVENEFPVRWSGDGRWLFVRGARSLEPPARLFRVDPVTGRREAWKELMPADPTGFEVIGTVIVSPDGQSYAYAYGTTFSQLVMAEGLR